MNEIDGSGFSGMSDSFFHLLNRGDHWLNHAFADFFSDVPILDRVVWHTNITSRGLLLAFVGLILLWLLPAAIECLLYRFGHVELNFRGDKIPQSYGITLLCWTGTMLLLDAWLLPGIRSERFLWFACLVGFGMLGLLDDFIGNKKIKGFRGHVRALLHDHRVTTGLVKAVGGLALAVWLGYCLHPHEPLLLVLSALVIALSANAMNLLDLRPGRAGGVFCLIAACLLITVWHQEGRVTILPLLYVLIPALVVWQRDARALVMLGDAGSNLLGAALGLALTIYISVPVQIIACLVLLAFHLLAERISLTALIEKNALLRSLDRLTGVRDNPSSHSLSE